MRPGTLAPFPYGAVYFRKSNPPEEDWARDYATATAVAEKIPERVLQEDPKLLMWYDQAVTRSGGE